MLPVTAVRTTGIFCRPECPATPLPANMIRHPDARSALFAGYRPCRRCSPDLPQGRDGERALRRLPTLAAARTRRRRLAEPGLVRLALVETPLGPMLAGASERGLCLLEFTDRPMLETQLTILQRRLGVTLSFGLTATHRALAVQLGEYFSGDRHRFDLPLDAPGTAFDERCWAALRGLDYGETVSYVELARRIGQPGAARAVGRSNGMNRLALVIPCHRVIAHDGRLGGYGGGLWRKRALLDLERGGQIEAATSAPIVSRPQADPATAALAAHD
jgi:O-6-methylguanine DNA methyltransferase